MPSSRSCCYRYNFVSWFQFAGCFNFWEKLTVYSFIFVFYSSFPLILPMLFVSFFYLFLCFILVRKYCKNVSEFTNSNFFILFFVVSKIVPVLIIATKTPKRITATNHIIILNLEWENRGNTISRHFTVKPLGVTVCRRELRSSMNNIRIGTVILRLITPLHGSVRGHPPPSWAD